MGRRPAVLPRLLAALPLAALGGGLLGGCDDNISCVFTTGCQDGPEGSLGTAPALRPEDDDWILPARPEIVAAFPDRTVAETAPILVVFSESIDPSGLTGAFELRDADFGGAGSVPVPLLPLGTLAAGRVAVLQPGGGFGGGGAEIPAGNWELRLTVAAEITDVTGQELESTGGVLTSFGVTATPPTEPVLVGTFPLDGDNGVSDVPEIVLAFDRALDAATVTSSSVQVEVGGADPVFDAEPEAFVTNPLLPVPDGRVFTWRSRTPLDEPASLGTSQSVTVELSPTGAVIESDEDPATDLPNSTFSFTTSPVAKPLGISLLSIPTDALGPGTLTPGDADELDLRIDLVAEGGDVVDLFVFGDEPEGDDPQLFALQRQKEIAGMGPVASESFDATEADLTETVSPLVARFADGGVSFAARLRRGSFVSPVVVLDVDDVTAGVQDPTLDLTGPAIAGFLTEGGVTTEFVTDQRDLVLAGDAGEELSLVEVTTAGANNGALAPVLATNGDLFLARPVALGLVDGPVPFTVTAYDAARNAADPIDATFVQRGRVGPDALVPGGSITVEVYDATTLEVLEGARVSTHADDGATTSFLGFADTLATGAASVPAASGTDDTILTVDLTGYDRWTFHGVPGGALSVPLVESSGAATEVVGTVLLDTALEVEFLTDDQALGDSRRSAFDDPYTTASTCSGGTGNQGCVFDALEVVPGRLGASSFLEGDFLLDAATFDADELLDGFELVVPQRPVAAGGTQALALPVRGAFDAASFGEEAVEILVPAIAIDGSGSTGIDLGMLEDDAAFTGVARVTVESTIVGVPGVVPVGLGLSQGTATPGLFLARVAIADSVRAGGAFAELLDDPADLTVRGELRDVDGNLVVGRASESAIQANGDTLVLPSVPGFGAITNTPGESYYEVDVENAIGDAAAVTGLYRVTLVDAAGRGWTAWRVDPPDATPAARVVFPDLTGAGGAPLASGTGAARVSSVGVPGLDLADFLWSDLARDHTLLTRSAPVDFVQP